MPKRAPRVCARPGCPVLAVPGKSYCPGHLKELQRRADEARPGSAARGYDHRWREIRRRYLGDHPTCEYCGRPATEVHHEVPLSRGGTHDLHNLVSLCRRCHSKVTAQRDGGFGNPTRW